MIILYTTGCPKCFVLESKLKDKGIQYEIITDTELMLKKGFNFMPILEVDGKTMEFTEAVQWVNRQGGQE